MKLFKTAFAPILYLIFSLSIISCGSDDSSDDTATNSNIPSTQEENILNPPQWIQGSWRRLNNPHEDHPITIEFTEDNYIIRINGKISRDFKEWVKEASSEGTFDYKEDVADKRYKLESSIYKGTRVTFDFTQGINPDFITDGIGTRFHETFERIK